MVALMAAAEAPEVVPLGVARVAQEGEVDIETTVIMEPAEADGT